MAPGKLAVEHLARDAGVDAVAHLRKQRRERDDFHILRALVAGKGAPKREHAVRACGDDAARAAGDHLLDELGLERAALSRPVRLVLQDLAAAEKRDSLDLAC